MTPNEYFMVHVMSRFLFNVAVVVWIFCHHPSRLHHRKWVQLSDMEEGCVWHPSCWALKDIVSWESKGNPQCHPSQEIAGLIKGLLTIDSP